MPTIQAIIRQRAIEILGDGRWHDYETVVRELSKVVPPGLAWRIAEQNRRNAGRITPVERQVSMPMQRLIQSGQRSAVREALYNWRRQSKAPFEIVPKGLPGRRVEKIPRRIRLTPKEIRVLSYWITHPSRFSEYGKIHQPTCRHAGTPNSHGYWVKDSEVESITDRVIDCAKCGGAGKHRASSS